MNSHSDRCKNRYVITKKNTKKAVEEQQMLKRERYESRCAIKKRRYLWCNNATLPTQGGHGWCKNATLPVRGLIAL